MPKIQAAITGVHGYVPEDVITNQDLEKMVDTNDEWITSRTGIKQRHILKGKDQGTSVMAVKAVEGLLKKTRCTKPKILIWFCVQPQLQILFFLPLPTSFPDKIGAVNAFGYDIQAACSGFLYALSNRLSIH